MSLFPKQQLNLLLEHTKTYYFLSRDERTSEAMDRSRVKERLAGKAWRWSSTSYASIDSIASLLSILSLYSVGSVLSIASAGSLLSIGSVGSILSIGSAGSILSIGGLGLFPGK